MRFHTAIACAAILLGCAASSSAQAVSLKFDNGRVSVNAQDASIRTILAEWARVGGTRMVNHERIGGAPVTLELTDVPERQALDVLLRSAAGYVVTQRSAASKGPSTIGGVVILATTSAPRNPAPVTFANAPPIQAPAFDNGASMREEEQGNNANRTVSVTPLFPSTPGASTPAVVRVGPGATAFGTPPANTPATAAPPPQGPSASPQILPGTSRPGEITPQPQQQPPTTTQIPAR